jgi:hypothetical protein
MRLKQEFFGVINLPKKIVVALLIKRKLWRFGTNFCRSKDKPVTYMTNDTPLLTLSQVRDWEARRAELRSLLARNTEELELLTLKIDAAKNLIDLLPVDMARSLTEELTESAENSTPNSKGDNSVSHVVLSAVIAQKGSAKANVIREWISEHHPSVSEKLVANPAYLYTSLMRHVKAGRLAKRGKSYRVPKSPSAGAPEPTTTETQAIE